MQQQSHSVQETGTVDALINNAGAMLLGQIDTQDAQELEDNVRRERNWSSKRHTVCTLAPMMERNTGTIINISSITR
ncbi:SDR family NAD(P)-dependent oxidoreductase [Vibrio lentus]|nr:SDR family NAD(P)-dependent oxidoreductase [Vibrio lentus]